MKCTTHRTFFLGFTFHKLFLLKTSILLSFSSTGHCGVLPAEGSVGSLVWEEVQGGVQEGARAFRTSPQRGSAPGAFWGKARTLRRTIGKSLVQSRCISRINLVRVSLIILFIFSTFPEDWGWYGNFQGICKNWTSCWVTLDINSGPLSDCRDEGRPNLGIIFEEDLRHSVGPFVCSGKCFYPSRKVSTRTRRYWISKAGAYE